MSRLEDQDSQSMYHTDSRFTLTDDRHFVIIVVQCYTGYTDKASSAKVCETLIILLVYSFPFGVLVILGFHVTS